MHLANAKTARTFLPSDTTVESVLRGIDYNRTALRGLIARERQARTWLRDASAMNPGLGRFYGTPKAMLAREVAHLRGRIVWGYRALEVLAQRTQAKAA